MEVLAAASDRAFLGFLGDGFSVEDLLIEPEGSDDQGAEDQAAVSSERRDLLPAPPTPSPPAASSGQLPQNPATELGFHAEDGAELEWLSQFVEDSFSESPSYGSENINLPRVQKTDPLSTERRFAVPVGARSKRSRRFPSSRAEPPGAVVVEAEPTKGKKKRGRKRKHQPRSGARCSHCGAGKTPQWRAGPTGAGTLCNACGVRFRSGRLLPEYRPACSPTFVSSVHSNCHRKVLELRRKKERAGG